MREDFCVRDRTRRGDVSPQRQGQPISGLLMGAITFMDTTSEPKINPSQTPVRLSAQAPHRQMTRVTNPCSAFGAIVVLPPRSVRSHGSTLRSLGPLLRTCSIATSSRRGQRIFWTRMGQRPYGRLPRHRFHNVSPRRQTFTGQLSNGRRVDVFVASNLPLAGKQDQAQGVGNSGYPPRCSTFFRNSRTIGISSIHADAQHLESSSSLAAPAKPSGIWLTHSGGSHESSRK